MFEYDRNDEELRVEFPTCSHCGVELRGKDPTNRSGEAVVVCWTAVNETNSDFPIGGRLYFPLSGGFFYDGVQIARGATVILLCPACQGPLPKSDEYICRCGEKLTVTNMMDGGQFFLCGRKGCFARYFLEGKPLSAPSDSDNSGVWGEEDIPIHLDFAAAS